MALLAPTRTCPRCHGHGVLWGGMPFRGDDDGTDEAPCPICGGAGTVATPAPSLAGLAAD